MLSFNPRARAGRDYVFGSMTSCLACFNPRARAGRDPSLPTIYRFEVSFNPRARAGRDLLCPSYHIGNHQFQSTRPRGARHFLGNGDASSCKVSIHAPARGATLPGQRGCLVLQSFNPRARAGRDSWRTINFTSTPSFNPRARAGRDLSARGAALGSSVSIHAPARGATKTGARRSGLGSGFNPRARAGRDALNRYFGTGIAAFQSTRPRGARRRYGKGLEDTLAFQSTRPRGARPQISLTARMSPCFNPRARAGRDGSVRSSQS